MDFLSSGRENRVQNPKFQAGLGWIFGSGQFLWYLNGIHNVKDGAIDFQSRFNEPVENTAKQTTIFLVQIRGNGGLILVMTKTSTENAFSHKWIEAEMYNTRTKFS